MPLVPNRTTSEEIGFAQSRRATAHWRRDGETADRITIGVVNNMPDGALKATERQFTSLLQAAGEGRSVRLRFFALAEIPRGQVAAAHIAANYGDLGELTQTSLDGLIVTGKEPRVPSLSAEPYWQSFTKLVDWAEHNTVSTIWSCLAAHAAVLHLDGVARHPLPRKRFGVFNCHAIAPDPLLAGAPPSLRVAHSRYNDLREAELAASGYRVLTRSPQAGVDMFVKRWRSLFVFLQGHPEYGPDSLAREYRRDVGRYLRGESQAYPAMPSSYFDAETIRALAQFETLARAKRDLDLMGAFPTKLDVKRALAGSWQNSTTIVFRNWLTYLSAHRAAKAIS